MRATRFPGTPEMVGTLMKVRVTEAREWTLHGEAL